MSATSLTAASPAGDGRAQARARVRAWRRWRALPGSLRLGLAIVAGAILLAVVGAVALPDPNQQQLQDALLPPGSAGHLLGTDTLGRDVLAWVAASVRTSFEVGLAVVLLSSLIGTAVGVVAGYAGGVLDALLMRIVDLQLAIPPLLLFIAASATVGHDLPALILLLTAVSWVPYARVVRTQVLVERRRASVAAARLAGVSRRRILLRHLLPATWTLVLVLASLQLGFVLLWEAALSFVGLGVEPPAESLGFMIAQGRDALEQAWWVAVFPGVMLGLLLLAANTIGDGLQERFGVEVEVLER